MSGCPAVLVGAGDAGMDELRPFVREDIVQWALLRFELGEGSFKRQKILFVHINSDGCPALARGRANQLTGDVKSALRGADDKDAIHASIEVKRRDELKVELVLERVAKFFITDGDAKYSVQWMLKEYERQIQQSSSFGKKSTSSGGGSFPPGRRVPGHASQLIFTSGRDALKAVGEALGPWNWVMLQADPKELTLVEGGDDSIDGMQRCVDSRTDLVMMGLLRMGFGEGRLRRTKYVFVHVNGTGVSAVARGKLGANRPKMEEALRQFALLSVSVEINDPKDLSLENIIERVRKAAIIDDDVLGKDEATKSIFTVEAFRQALAEEQVVTASFVAEGEEDEAAPIPGSEYTTAEAVRLIHAQDQPLNWALFAPNQDWIRQRKSLGAPLAIGAPSAVPTGGYLAAKRRSCSAGVRRASGGTHEEEQPEEQAEEVKIDVPRVSLRGSARTRSSSALPLGSGKGYPSDAAAEAETGMHSVQSFITMTSGGGGHRASGSVAAASSVPTQSLPAEQQPTPPAPGTAAASPGGPSRPRLVGPLLKQSGAWLRGWQLRWFEVGSGHIRWWDSPEEAVKGSLPKGCQPLVGMKVSRVDGMPTQFTLETSMGKDKVYLFDANTSQYVAKAGWGIRAGACTVTITSADWIKALEMEAKERKSSRTSTGELRA